MGFFELGTPASMLEKAKRELARLEAEVSIDNVFNFFVTAWSIRDYIDEPVKKNIDNDIFEKKDGKDTELQLCGDVGNKAKHMELKPKKQQPKGNKRPDPKTPKDHFIVLQTAGAPLDASKPSVSVRWRIQWQGGESREVVSFAQEVIAKWEELFALHGIPTADAPPVNQAKS